MSAQIGQRPRAPCQENRAAVEERDHHGARPSDEQALEVGRLVLRLAELLGIGATPAADPLLTADRIVATFAESGVTERVAADAMRAGELPAVKVGRRLAARPSDVEAWLASRKVKPRAPKAKAADVTPEAAYQALVHGGGR
jgi:hypothetical protein